MNPVPPVTSLTIGAYVSSSRTKGSRRAKWVQAAVIAVTIPRMADIPPPPPGTPPPMPPNYQPPPRSFSDIPPSAQGYGNVPPAAYPQAPPGISLTSQFTGL